MTTDVPVTPNWTMVSVDTFVSVAVDTFVQSRAGTAFVVMQPVMRESAVNNWSFKMSNTIRGGLPERGEVVQSFGSLESSRIGLPDSVRAKSVAALNRLLAHTMALRDLYKKAHWQTGGASFYELHLLFDKHHGEQLEIMDALAERVQTLGGVALALAHDVAEETRIARAPRGRERVVDQLRRLVDAHEIVLEEARPLAREAAGRGDDGSNDLIVSQVVRTNELQSWFVYEHLHAHDAPRQAEAPAQLLPGPTQ